MRLIQIYFSQIYGSHHAEIKWVRELCCDLKKFYNSKSSTVEESQRSTSYLLRLQSKNGGSSSTSLANRKNRYLKFKEFVNNAKNNVDDVKL